MNLKPTYPLPDDLEKFSEELLQSKIPNELLANCQYDSTYFELLKRNISDRILKELSKNSESKGKNPTSGINYMECNTPLYKQLNLIKTLVEKHLNLCIKRRMQPTTWSDDQPFKNNPCCNFIEKTLEEFKEKFNPNELTYFIFFKSFYYHSLTDFDNFKTNAEQIKTTLNRGNLFKKEQREFFFKKILEDVKNKNNRVHYVERLIQFEKEFIKPPYSTCTTEEFKTDISELCENCPLTDKINNGIENQIIFQANIKKEILPPDNFLEYIYSEINSASEVIDRVYSIELRNKEYNINDQQRANRIELFIWNKERIKALKSFIPEDTNSPSNKKRNLQNDPSFVQLFKNNEDRLNKFIQLLKGIHFSALDENNSWIYNSRKSSIVACFKALEELEFIKKLNNDTQLYRVVKNHIDFKGNEKLFRNQFNQDDYDDFYNKFNSHLK